jgi:hypothetical protein
VIFLRSDSNQIFYKKLPGFTDLTYQPNSSQRKCGLRVERSAASGLCLGLDMGIWMGKCYTSYLISYTYLTYPLFSSHDKNGHFKRWALWFEVCSVSDLPSPAAGPIQEGFAHSCDCALYHAPTSSCT